MSLGKLCLSKGCGGLAATTVKEDQMNSSCLRLGKDDAFRLWVVEPRRTLPVSGWPTIHPECGRTGVSNTIEERLRGLSPAVLEPHDTARILTDRVTMPPTTPRYVGWQASGQ